MSNGNGNKFDPDAFAKALAPAFKALGDTFGKKIDELGTRMDAGFGELGGRIDGLGVRIDGVCVRIDVLGDRLEGLIENQGAHYRALESRIERLEGAVFPKKNPS